MQELARRLQDLRAKDKAYPGAVSTVPFRSHGCTVTISYDFSGGFCHVRFEQEGLPSEDDNLKFVLSKDGGSYTLYLNRAGNPNTLTLESTLGSLNVNHAACPPQYRDFMMSVARVVAELFPVDTAETASTYTGGSASAAVERSIAIASQRPSTSRDVSVAAAAASTLKHSMRDIALAGLSAINESKFGQDRLNGMSDVQKYALKNCGQILTALLKAESAGAALAALFDGRTVASNGETVVRFVKDGTGGKLKFIAFSTEEIDQAFRDLATGSSATTEGILSEIAGFYGLAS